MTDLTEMWNELARYQPYAEKHGFGETWRRMCEERTERAAWNTSDAARAVAKAAGGREFEMGREFEVVEDTPWIASRVASAAATAAVRAAAGLGWPAGNLARRAIKNIRKAIEQENKL